MSTKTASPDPLKINVRVSGTLKEHVNRSVGEGDYENVSEYVRDLIRKDKAIKEEEAFQALKATLQAAFAVPESECIETSADDIRRMAKSRLKA